MKLTSMLAGLFLFLSGCSGPKPEDYKDQEPKLDLKTYLNGHFEAWGMIQKPNGRVVKFMRAELDASWSGEEGTLREHFTFSDGKEQRRQWTLKRIDDHHYTAAADDAVGLASITVYGNAMQWDYSLRVPVDDSIYTFQFDDWLYLVQDNVLLNRAKMKKFGFTVAELTIFFQKR